MKTMEKLGDELNDYLFKHKNSASINQINPEDPIDPEQLRRMLKLVRKTAPAFMRALAEL
jgi:hypothetical protein